MPAPAVASTSAAINPAGPPPITATWGGEERAAGSIDIDLSRGGVELSRHYATTDVKASTRGVVRNQMKLARPFGPRGVKKAPCGGLFVTEVQRLTGAARSERGGSPGFFGCHDYPGFPCAHACSLGGVR